MPKRCPDNSKYYCRTESIFAKSPGSRINERCVNKAWKCVFPREILANKLAEPISKRCIDYDRGYVPKPENPLEFNGCEETQETPAQKIKRTLVTDLITQLLNLTRTEILSIHLEKNMTISNVKYYQYYLLDTIETVREIMTDMLHLNNNIKDEEDNILTAEYILNLGKFNLTGKPGETADSIQSKTKFLFKRLIEVVTFKFKQTFLEDIDLIQNKKEMTDFVGKYKYYLFDDDIWSEINTHILNKSNIDETILYNALHTRFKEHTDLIYDSGVLKIDKEDIRVRHFVEDFLGLDLNEFRNIRGLPFFNFHNMYVRTLRKKFTMELLESDQPDSTILNLLKVIDIFENNNLQEREILLRPKYDNAYTNNYDFTTIRNPNVFSMPIQNVKS